MFKQTRLKLCFVLVLAFAAFALAQDLEARLYTSKIMLDGNRWMTQNLNINVPGSYCYDGKESNCGQYGRLYTWEAAKNACNEIGHGWRLPSYYEWRAMAKQYGGVRDDVGNTGKAAYKALIEGGTSGFNVVLGGGRESDGKYARLDAHGFYWSATETDTGHAWLFNFGKGAELLNNHSDIDKKQAYSVRCMKAGS